MKQLRKKLDEFLGFLQKESTEQLLKESPEEFLKKKLDPFLNGFLLEIFKGIHGRFFKEMNF